MEKRKPHCPLATAQSLIEEGKIRYTGSALAGAAAMGFDESGIIQVLLSLTMHDFYKSMTTYADNTIWQDVYRPTHDEWDIYLKITVQQDVAVISFKEL